MRLLYEIVRDPIFRGAAILALVSPLVALDLAVNKFRGWAVLLAGIGAVALGAAWSVSRLRAEKRKRRIEADLPSFEAQRVEALRRKLSQDPAFLTPCHACGHFSASKRVCTLDLPGRRMWIKLEIGPTAPSFCLYWNVFAPGHLLRDGDLQSKRI